MPTIETTTPTCVSASSCSSSVPFPVSSPVNRPLAVSVSTSSNGLESIVAGIIAGCVTRSCTSPLDVLKIIIQVNGPSFTKVSVPVRTTPTIGTLARRGSTSAISSTVRNLYSSEGVRGFWKGNLAGCCRLGPYAGSKFFLYDILQQRFLGDSPTNVQRALCGATAGLLATMGTYPMEVVRTRVITQTAQTPHYLRIHGVFHGLRVILRHEGVRGLYKGGWSGIVGAIPFEGVQFGCYEYLKRTAHANHWPACRWPEGKQELDGVDFFVCGSIAGAIAQTVAYPFDTVKKRLQTQRAVQYHGMVDCFRKVVREEGLLALYRGTVPNLARIVPYAAVMFSTYELTKKTLRLLSETQAATPAC